MSVVTIKRGPPKAGAPARDGEARPGGARQRVSAATDTVRARATTLIGPLQTTIHASRTGADRATSALQRLPDPALRSLMASSVGFGAGLYLAGSPRLAVVAGIAPAFFAGAAMARRPLVPPETSAPAGSPKPDGSAS